MDMKAATVIDFPAGQQRNPDRSEEESREEEAMKRQII